MQLKVLLSFLGLTCLGVTMCLGDASMPVVTRGGVAYYQYQVKEGESLYGIAKSTGWDYDLLVSLNPASSEKLRKGDLLVYPTGDTVSLSSEITETGSTAQNGGSGRVVYEVPSSISPYEAAKRLNVTTDQLYAQNPWARKGLRKGDRIVIDYDKLESSDSSLMETDEVLKGDVTSEVASRFSHAEAEIFEKMEDTSSRVVNDDVPDVERENEEALHGVSTRNPLIGLDRNLLMEYTIQQGENVADVADNFNTTVRDIYFLNKALSESWFPAGVVIELLPGSRDLDHKNVVLKHRVKVGESQYKIQNEDTWESVAAANRLTVAELRGANSGLKEFKKGKKLVVPQIETVTELKDVVFTDPRSQTSEGRNQIYREVANYGKPVRNSDNLFDIVVLTSRSSTDLKRDREFLRGFLLGVNDSENYGHKFGVQVIDITDRRLASVYMQEAKSNRPDLIVATFEKDLPDDLVDYASSHGANVVNVFDAKNTRVNTDASVLQVLQPSDMMNDAIASKLYKEFNKRQFVFVDDNSNENGNYSQVLKKILTENGIRFNTVNSISELQSVEPIGNKGVIIISNANSQSAISTTLQNVQAFKESHPGLLVSVVGRPTWIVYAERMKQLFKECDIYIPSRFYYDEDAEDWKQFCNKFSEYYNAEPTASFPPYAAMGYDVARSFITMMLLNDGDFNNPVVMPVGVNMNFDFNRQNAHSGMINTNLYLMHYSRYGISSL